MVQVSVNGRQIRLQSSCTDTLKLALALIGGKLRGQGQIDRYIHAYRYSSQKYKHALNKSSTRPHQLARLFLGQLLLASTWFYLYINKYIYFLVQYINKYIEFYLNSIYF